MTGWERWLTGAETAATTAIPYFYTIFQSKLPGKVSDIAMREQGSLRRTKRWAIWRKKLRRNFRSRMHGGISRWGWLKSWTALWWPGVGILWSGALSKQNWMSDFWTQVRIRSLQTLTLDWKWQKVGWELEPNQRAPLNRRGHTLVFYPPQNKFYLYGGAFGFNNILKDILVFSYDH